MKTITEEKGWGRGPEGEWGFTSDLWKDHGEGEFHFQSPNFQLIKPGILSV